MSKTYKIAVLPGDGIGPEIIDQGIKVLNAVSKRFGVNFEFTKALIGGAAIDVEGVPLPDSTLELAKNSDAVFMGSIGDWKYDKLDPAIRPECGLLKIRKELNLFANLRPVVVYDELAASSTLKEDVVKGVDIMMVRELTSGLYFGEPKGIELRNGEKVGFNTMIYKESEIERIVRLAFDIAMKRRKKLCSVDKANVLDVSRLWREVVERVAKDYPEVELSHIYVDNAAMQLVRNPKQYDVMVMENMFGDILSDEASMLTGSLGMLASASLTDKGPALYEPSHGSAPDIKGQDKANPIATIMSAAMMLKYSFNLDKEANAMEEAIKQVLKEGYRTADIMSEGASLVGTNKMGDLVSEKIVCNILN
ncbi:MAG: 3-isopropylmalate dehydrogenase [Candidatus Melainabacteria bacterium GWF2_37_15]|nr:MAG: 3-isopropylmalate dehydrogenase [Candidatus Melainabacteria bacterium GWF2_37_15]